MTTDARKLTRQQTTKIDLQANYLVCSMRNVNVKNKHLLTAIQHFQKSGW